MVPAAKKIRWTIEAVRLLKNADRVSNFCNDVIGDICGIVSIAIGATLVFRILLINPSIESALLSAAITEFISSLRLEEKQ